MTDAATTGEGIIVLFLATDAAGEQSRRLDHELSTISEHLAEGDRDRLELLASTAVDRGALTDELLRKIDQRPAILHVAATVVDDALGFDAGGGGFESVAPDVFADAVKTAAPNVAQAQSDCDSIL